MLIKPIAVRLSSGQESVAVTRINADPNTKNEEGRARDLDVMSAEEIWQFQEETSQRLTVRLASEKRQLDGQLAPLRGTKGIRQSEPSDAPSLESERRAQRKYPRGFPKYRNPKEPSETWSERGKQPRWLAAA
jgi:DNA-binding protein H-NS